MTTRWIPAFGLQSVLLLIVLVGVVGCVDAKGNLTATPTLQPRQQAHPQSQVMTIAAGPLDSEPTGLSPTSTEFVGNGARGRFAISHGKLLASGTRSLYAELRVAADRTSDQRVEASPIALALVIDTSGSMAGRKIEDAKHAAHSLLENLRPDDLVAIVRYASDARVIVPLSRVGSARTQSHNAIDRLFANGNTDIAGGLLRGAELLANIPRYQTRRIVLVTDGRDTSGAPRNRAANLARAEADAGMTISALGIGDDYDAEYLANVADNGRGNYEYLRDTSSLASFLHKELRETSTTTVTDVVASLDLPTTIRVRDVWGANWSSTPNGLRLSLGSLYAGDERRVIVVMEVEAGSPGSWTSLRGDISWHVVGSSVRVGVRVPAVRVAAVTNAEDADRSIDPTVVASYTSVAASRREAEAAAAFERGERARAMELNQQNQRDLEQAARNGGAGSAQLQAQKRAYEQHGRVYATQPAAAAPARKIGAQEKANASRAYAY